MSENNHNKFDPEQLLKSLLPSHQIERRETLKEIFERRLKVLGITMSTAISYLEMEFRTLNGMLDGTLKRVDVTNLLKIATFLQLSNERVIQLYLESIENTFPDSNSFSPQKIQFIQNNFDLIALRNAGFINSITDFPKIEQAILSYFNLKTIFEYKRPSVDVAFSAGKIKPKNELMRSFWIKSAKDIFEEIGNPNEYNRQALIDFFPEIRWHSTSVELGLRSVMKALYKMGVTVIYQPTLPSLHLRGATFSVSNKPCIVFTNYKGFYPTIWFALIHELFHVLFDWPEISSNEFHLSDDKPEQLSVKEKEDEANTFAREYLFSKEKSAQIRPHLHNQMDVEEFAMNNQVHSSFIWVFDAFDMGNSNRMAWSRARKKSPPIDSLLDPLSNAWASPKPIPDFVKSIEYLLYK